MSTTFKIDVLRKGKDGILTFRHAAITISETCWWDPDVVVDAGTYTGYATRMANKSDGTDGGKREAIWLGKKVPVNGNSRMASGIFIHKGTSAAWSDGCIVMQGAKVYEMWTTITPKETANILVTVRDEQVQHGKPLPYKCMVADWF